MQLTDDSWTQTSLLLLVGGLGEVKRLTDVALLIYIASVEKSHGLVYTITYRPSSVRPIHPTSGMETFTINQFPSFNPDFLISLTHKGP